jgi:CopG family nickel-responsive transcriptional regulator
VILLRGPARQIRNLADNLIGTKGVETGRLVLASAKPVPAGNSGEPTPRGHSHVHGHPHHHDRRQSAQDDG